jgi:hypothetical protein
MTQCVDLPQPLGPGRKWGTVHHIVHGFGYFLQDETDNFVHPVAPQQEQRALGRVDTH